MPARSRPPAAQTFSEIYIAQPHSPAWCVVTPLSDEELDTLSAAYFDKKRVRFDIEGRWGPDGIEGYVQQMHKTPSGRWTIFLAGTPPNFEPPFHNAGFTETARWTVLG